MRRSWIKIGTNTPHKPEVCAIASSLRVDPDLVVGKLVRLWSWAELNVDSANVASVTREFLDRIVGRTGFAAALERAGWLEGPDGALVFPNFDRHNGQAARIRAQTADRVSKHRLRKRIVNDTNVTKTPPPTFVTTASGLAPASASSDVDRVKSDVKPLETIDPNVDQVPEPAGAGPGSLPTEAEGGGVAEPSLDEGMIDVDSASVHRSDEPSPYGNSKDNSVTGGRASSEATPEGSPEVVVGPAEETAADSAASTAKAPGTGRPTRTGRQKPLPPAAPPEQPLLF